MINGKELKITHIVDFLEKQFAPLTYQESYDNSGLLIGDENTKLGGILIALDLNLEVLQEAIEKQYNLIITHHPILFEAIKKITGKSNREKVIIQAIKNDIAVYSAHTNLDNILSGFNYQVGHALLGLKDIRVLKPKEKIFHKLITYAPKEHVQTILTKLHEIGAGNIGDYTNCSFVSQGKGSFKPLSTTKPYVGDKNTINNIAEEKIEITFHKHLKTQVIQALQDEHPYEEVTYEVYPIALPNSDVGSGIIGKLPSELSQEVFLRQVKKLLNLKIIRHSKLNEKKIKTVAYSGGGGRLLIEDAVKQKADIFISAELKHQDFIQSENQIILADIGHYESEKFANELLYARLSEKFKKTPIGVSKANTNPIQYLL